VDRLTNMQNVYIAHNNTYTFMDRTTIAIPPNVRNRLRGYGMKGMSYAEILTHLMDEVDRERFISEMRRLADEGDFVSLESV
jgi:hypothetical protein